ncbi:hypothetical protein CNR22_17875 [Sphingobacteriaceae bacterium]|nr:hypothetical protein CNR22_17875 [Sphingobacteriaceae bacterium]
MPNFFVDLQNPRSLISMNTTLRKTQLSFSHDVLNIKFVENSVIEVEDVIFIYCYAIERSKGKPYGVLFDTYSKHELTEEAILYFTKSAQLNNVIAIAYISKDLISKIRLSLLKIFERPPVKIKLFSDEEKGSEWLIQEIEALEVMQSA